jgi:DNA-nicking Smr family endonuclease
MGKRETADKKFSLPEEINPEEFHRMQAEILDRTDKIEELDLHGFSREEAIHAVEQFITDLSFSAPKIPACRITHGKGKGILRKAVTEKIESLKSEGVIEAYFPSVHYPGGAILVTFKS